jgi:hypothetical protein
MNATEFTFGVELETLVPDRLISSGELGIGGYHNGRQVSYLPEGWKAENDGSLRAEHSGWRGCEIVSPVLRGPEGIARVAEVIRKLEEKGHRVNMTCGVHVHIGWSHEYDMRALARLVTIVAYVEKGLYAITGTKSRELGRYCGGLRKYETVAKAQKEISEYRYHTLNLTNLASGRKRTVEFRCFSGSLNPTKVCGWIMVCLGLVERAFHVKRCPSWAPKAPKGGWAKKGEGQSECERLLGYLAWSAGAARLHGGKKYGWIHDGISQDAVKAEFRRLAKKYDGAGDEA